ncbi:MAG TPA: GNAT family N-acetyltransferase [Terracidiphilus sp.]|jgi:GNAT superfamily N-acetyltransferase|nr:GNAT family N-acetyltransferase [Terracidiphilus sp.]
MPNPTAESASSTLHLSRGGHHIVLRPFQPGDETAFRTLNEQWIAKYFRIEDKDRETLGDPAGKILAQGGHVYFALIDGEKVGTCALIAMGFGVYEVAKMAVEESFRGSGIGRAILEYAIERAAGSGAQRLYLETNDRLANAIRLYEGVGFRHLPPEQVKPSPYARANVFMEKFL